MLHFSQLYRLFTINRIIIRHGLDEIILAIPVFKALKFIYYFLPWNWIKRERPPLGTRIRLALEDLGPIFIKFGQMLSTRRDLLPDEIADELARLQDRVPPFAYEQAEQLLRQAYGQNLDDVFQRFDRTPIASASIAQVYGAKLWGGQEVVVKVVRPNIEKTIQGDIELLDFISHLAQRYWKEGKRLRPVEVVEEYRKTIFDELDLIREAANASQLRRNFEHIPELYIPDVHWDYCRKNVMVMERIYGIPVGNTEALIANGTNMKKLSERGVEIFFTQVFAHNFFHADMHPGNIFVSPQTPEDPFYMAVDFGIVGTLTPEDQRYLAENFHAFFNRDYKRVAELHVESGWVPAGTRVNEFEAAIRTVCEPIFNKPLKDISFGHVLLRLFQTARRFNMEIQPQLVLLQKTLLNIEGLGRQLYPDLDLWATAKPFLSRWMDEQVGVRALLKGVKTNLPRFLEQLPAMPSLSHELLQQATQNKLQLHWESQQLERLREEMQVNQRRNRLTLLGSVCLLIAAILMLGGQGLQVTTNLGFEGWGLLIIGLILIFYGLFR